MLKNISYAVLGALICAMIGLAHAGVGTVPQNGFATVDGTWLNGLANGLNRSYQYGLTGAGTTQATAAQLPSQVAILEADTVASSSGFNLPPAYKGTEILFYNNGANTATIYPAVANNPNTSAQDTINNSTSLSVSSHTAEIFFSPKDGIWAAK